MAVRLKRRKGGSQRQSCRSNALKKIVCLNVIEDGIPRSGCDGVSLVGESVLERARAILECIDHTRCYKNGAKGSVTAGNSLPCQNNVWLDVPMLHGKRFAAAPHPSHHFVSD